MDTLTDDELIQRAIEAYRNHCEDSGFVYQQPAAAACEVDGDRVHLRNSYHHLATVRRRGDKLVVESPNSS